jgi:hypothetical protein
MPGRKGPAITLTVRITDGTKLSVDLVPCLVFDEKKLPENIRKHLGGLPLESHESVVCIHFLCYPHQSSAGWLTKY